MADLAAIAGSLHGRRKPGGGYTCRCPAHDDRNPSLSIDEGEDGRLLVKCFAGCDGRDVLAALDGLGLLPPLEGGTTPRRSTLKIFRGPVEPPPPVEANTMALAIWNAAGPVEGTLTETYLRGRGLLLPYPEMLRHHGALLHKPSGLRLPAMVGAVQSPDGRTVAIHRAFLNEFGRKAVVGDNKLMLGPCSGGAVRLAPAGSKLAVAEGIETALSVQQESGWPTWAALSTSGMKALELPAEVREVLVCADNDKPGEDAAQAAAQRWVREGRKVRIARPPAGVKDFNDALTAEAAPKVVEVAR